MKIMQRIITTNPSLTFWISMLASFKTSFMKFQFYSFAVHIDVNATK